MYIEIEAPGRQSGRTPAVYVGPFADRSAAEAAIDRAANVVWEPERRVTGNGVTLMARAIVATRPRRIPTVPHIPADREEFALLAYQYA